MPRQRVAATRDDASTTFQAAVVLDVNQAVVAECVDARGTDERAKFDRAFRLAHVMVDRDMAFGVNLIGIETEFRFDVDGHRTSFIRECGHPLLKNQFWLLISRLTQAHQDK